mmetsp:Transcript_5588/g.12334  ORF Transcript_5588/g.12334 Transcript_5588/m.12334 type:complete len:102 (+) Transcript_5588:257-562(+)
MYKVNHPRFVRTHQELNKSNRSSADRELSSQFTYSSSPITSASPSTPSFLTNFFTTFSSIQPAVLKANPILRGTANLAKFTKANASAPTFCISSPFPKSGQ